MTFQDPFEPPLSFIPPRHTSTKWWLIFRLFGKKDSFSLVTQSQGSAGGGKHRDSQDTSQDIRSFFFFFFFLLLHFMVRVAKMSFLALDHRLVLSV